MKISPDLKRFAIKLFDRNVPPFEKVQSEYVPPEKKPKTEVSSASDLEIVKCCYNLLKVDASFFRDLWNWSVFVNNYLYKGNGLQQIYTFQILRIIDNVPPLQMELLTSKFCEQDLITFKEDDSIISKINHTILESENVVEKTIKLTISNKMIENFENVLLPIYNLENASQFNCNGSRPVFTTSTKQNLRSIAMGISSGKAVCLTGPVGCGKTTLIEYIAGKTGRFKDKISNSKIQKDLSLKKRKKENENVFEDVNILSDAFVRIQLGDQTDGKMLLGQYRCTDVPGEFIWQPGVLTQVSFH